MSLMDRLIEPVKEYVSFPDLMYSLSSFNNEPLRDLVYYLECRDLESLNTYTIDSKYNIKPIEDAQECTHSFLENVSVILTSAARARKWVLQDINSLDELPADTKSGLVEIFDAHAGIYFKVSEILGFTPLKGCLDFLDPELESSDAIGASSNHSLASYVTDYTLPQVVALILHIDLADITTSSNHSYIHEQGKYDESTYSKFDNLLQSYSTAALNNKIDGADVFTRRAESIFGAPDTQTNLEKTTISRSHLASYLNSIGYQLDDLIAKQEPVHAQYSQYDGYQQDDSELVSNLRQQVADLQSRLDEKDKELKLRSAKLDLALKKIKELDVPAYAADDQINNRSERSYQTTIGLLIEMLTEPRTKGGTPPFSSEAQVIAKMTEKAIYGQGKTKLGERFKEAKEALADEKKKGVRVIAVVPG